MQFSRWHEKPRKALIVSENSFFTKDIVRGFQKVSQEVRAVSSVVKAVDTIAPRNREVKWRPDVIVCEWKMQPYNGLELLYIVRQELKIEETVFVLLYTPNPLFHVLPFIEFLKPSADLCFDMIEHMDDAKMIVRGVIEKWEEQMRSEDGENGTGQTQARD